jgi:hypothetical protein
MVVRAWGLERIPNPIFYIAGGPGNAATSADIIAGITNLFVVINKDRDIVFLDQPGTNDNHRLTCEYPSILIMVHTQAPMRIGHRLTSP